MIQFKKIRMHQDHVRNFGLTNDASTGRKKKKKDKDKKPAPLKVRGIPTNIDGRKTMWDTCKEIADPDRPVPPEGYESDDENGSGRFSSADENSGIDDNNGRRFSSGDENSVVDDNNGRFSSEDESSDEKESNVLGNDLSLLTL
jgi:hypothetical protein